MQSTSINGQSLDEAGAYIVPALCRGRLYLFIPQFTIQTEQPTKSLPSTESMRTMAEKTGVQTTPRKFWELRLGWTELRSGKCSTKRISNSSLEIPNDTSKGNPLISRFQFFVSTISSTTQKVESAMEDDVIVLDVEA